ncbi:hypothetical protein V5O48_015803 [Marasmius crinis-equi]|uniref:Uncharacterized protein n=1 Tax=Marasmius crinis-equi TaxID=585013 RepID=A0ABR3ETH4_9AGAR
MAQQSILLSISSSASIMGGILAVASRAVEPKSTLSLVLAIIAGGLVILGGVVSLSALYSCRHTSLTSNAAGIGRGLGPV